MKKFFEKARLEYKFKKAGEGHTLEDDSRPSSRQQASTSQTPTARTAPSSDAQRAGLAALERMSAHEKNAVKKPKSATATWKHSGPASSTSQSTSTENALNVDQLKREVRQEMAYQRPGQARELQKLSLQSNAEPTEVDCSTVLSHEGVYFSCPLCPVTVLQSEMDAHLSDCLHKHYREESLTSSCSMIYSLNKDKEKVKACVDLLCRYLDNICKNPEEEKYQKIKQGNKIFQERVAPIRGAAEFLLACGFEDKVLSVEDSEEKVFVLPKEACSDCERLNVFKEVLVSSEALKPKLDRCLKVYQPSSQANHFEVPSDFFTKSADEVKREQIARTEEVERNSQLRTRAMREAEKRPSKTYRFTLLRVRFPDGIILQGTFYSREKLRDVFEFVRQSLVSDWQPFFLSEATRQLTDDNASLIDLGLVPAAVVSFKWDPSVLRDILASQGQVDENVFLKPELLQRVQELR